MNDHHKTKSQLIEELQQTRQLLADLSAAEDQRRQAEAELRASQATLQLFVDHTPSAVAMFDTEMRYLAASRRWIADYQLAGRPLIGLSHYEIFPEIGPDWKAVHQRCLAGAVESRGEDPFPRADGSLDWVHWEVRPWYAAENRIGGIIVFTEVITKRKQAEAALLESEKRFRVAQDLSLDAFTILRSVRDPQGQIIDFEWVYANPVAGRILKHPPEELIGRRLLEVLPGNGENQALFERYVRIVESGQGDEVELEYRSESIAGWFRNLAVKLDDGLAVSFSDITQRKQTEEALRHSEQKYATLFTQMMSGCSLQEIICDEQGRPIDYVTLDVNAEFERLLGVPKVAVVGARASAFLPPAELDSWLNVFGPVALTGVPARYHNYSPQNQKTFEGVVFCPQPGQFAVMFTDVTDRQRTEDALRESEKRFASAFEFASIGVALVSTTGAFLKVNQALCHLLGYTAEELTALTFQAITHPDDLGLDLAQVQQMLAGTINTYQLEKRYFSKHGNLVWVLLSVSLIRDAQNHPEYFIAQIQDITRRKQAETGHQILLEIMQGAVVTHNLTDFLHLVHQAIAKVLYAENLFVILYNPDTGLFEEVYSVDKFDPPAAPDRLDGSISAYVFRTGQPLLLDKARFAQLAAQGAAKLVGTDSTSWLGVPLKTADTTIGVMVVQDYDQPDRYSERDTEFLVSIAGQVALAVERQRAEEALRKSQSLLAETERLGHVGGWELNIDTQSQIWTEEVHRIHEVALTYQPTVSEGINFYTPESRPIIEQAVQRAIEQSEPFDVELEIITAQSNRRWVQAIGQADLEHRRVFGFFQDITERKRAEDALRELSHYNRSLIEASLDPLVTIDRAGHIADVNAATEHITGYSRQELIGTDFSNYFTDPAHAQAGYEQVFRDGQVRDYALELRHRAGTITSVLYNASVYRDEAGQVLGVFAAARDITERKRAQEALRLSEARYRSLIETQTEMIARSDLSGHLTFVNAAYCQMFGESPDNLLNGSFKSTVLPEDLPISLEAIRAIQSPPFRVISETRHVTPYGIRWIEWDNSAVLDEQQHIIELQGTGRDITERKRAEAAEREQRQLAEALRDTAAALNSTLNFDEVLDRILISMDRVIAYDSAAILLLDEDRRTANVARRRSHHELIDPAEALLLRLPLAQAFNLQEMLTTQQPMIIEDTRAYPGWIHNPNTAWIRSNLSLPIIILGQPIGFLSVNSARLRAFTATDVEHLSAFSNQVATAIQNAQLHEHTRRYADELEQRVNERTLELQAANARLTELDRLKDEFIARIGHELRTPLTSIKIYLELLEAGKPEKREKYLNTLKREADRLYVLIEDLLRVRQLSAETFEPQIAPGDINQLIDDRLMAWRERAVHNGLDFHTQLAVDLPQVLIDPEYTAQVLGHVVNNAINYTPGGNITLSTALQSDEAGRWVTVSVKDTGPGITPDDLAHIFDQFYRGRAAADYKTPGTGVGLSISREIMHKLHGRLTVDTKVGVGSTFMVWLPVADDGA